MVATVTLAPDGMPHGYCYLWNPALVWLHVISDSLIAAAYFTIPVTLVYFVRKRRDVPFNWIFVCFGVFILACGATHLMSVYNVWVPAWWLAGGVKTVTALASVPTAFLLYRLVPEALKLPSPRDMAEANVALRDAQNALERRVAERTAELAAANAAVAQSRERYRSLVEATAQIVWHTDEHGLFKGEQPGWSSFTGQTTAQLLNTGGQDVVSPDDRDRITAQWQRAISTGLPLETTCRIRRRDGEYRHMAVRAIPVREGDSPILEWVGTHTDITEKIETEEQLRRTENQLLQAQRMEAIGRLAGGVAHDFNNLLTVITGASQLLLEQLPIGSEQRADVVDIDHAATRAAYLTGSSSPSAVARYSRCRWCRSIPSCGTSRPFSAASSVRMSSCRRVSPPTSGFRPSTASSSRATGLFGYTASLGKEPRSRFISLEPT
jgi:PAS domain S-box-containing protein